MPRRLSPDEAALWARVAGTTRPIVKPKSRNEPDQFRSPKSVEGRPAPVKRASGSPARHVDAGTASAAKVPAVSNTLDSSWDKRIAGGRVKVLLHLLAPNFRPQQVTDDLASFWANGYPLVRKELRARYPKHSWPDDPLTAEAMRGAKRRS